RRGNEELSGINQRQSGSPFSVRQNTDYAGVGAGSGNQFWSLVGDPSMEPTSFGNDATWFNKAAFCTACRRYIRRAAAQHPAKPRLLGVGPGDPQELPGHRKTAPPVPDRVL